MYRTVLLSLALVALALAPASNAWATNSVFISLSRLDDFLFPDEEFLLDVNVVLDEAGVTSVSVQAGSVAVSFEEFSPGEWEGSWDTEPPPSYRPRWKEGRDGSTALTNLS